jgi:hypothetical protein
MLAWPVLVLRAVIPQYLDYMAGVKDKEASGRQGLRVDLRRLSLEVLNFTLTCVWESVVERVT